MKVLVFLFVITFSPFSIFSQERNVLINGNKDKLVSSETQFFLGVISNYNFGSTDYTLKADSKISNENYSELKSLLVFPIESYNIGLSFEIAKAMKQDKKWTIQLVATTNVNSPSNFMIDRDWIGKREVSSTKSHVNMRSYFTFAKFEIQLLKKPDYYITAFSNISYDKINQDIDGYKGWIKDEYDNFHNISGTERVIEYNVSYLSNIYGLGVHWDVSEHLHLKLKSGGGLVLAKDYDFHILRNKKGYGKGLGYTFYSMSNISYSIRTRTPEKFTIGLTMSLNYHHSNGKQRMVFQNVDGALEQETIIKGIPHKFNYLRTSVGLSFEVKL